MTATLSRVLGRRALRRLRRRVAALGAATVLACSVALPALGAPSSKLWPAASGQPPVTAAPASRAAAATFSVPAQPFAAEPLGGPSFGAPLAVSAPVFGLGTPGSQASSGTPFLVSPAADLLAQAPAPAAPPVSPVTVTADHLQYNTQTGDVVADGHVHASRGDTTITADHMTGNLLAGEVVATGHVVLTEAGHTTTGNQLHYNYRTRVGQMAQQSVSTYGPWTIHAGSITTANGQGVAYNTSFTPCNPQHPPLLVTARKVVIVPGDYIKAYHAVLRLYGVPILYVPVYTASLRRNRGRTGVTFGYDSFNGLWVQYDQAMQFGDLTDQLSLRYGTLSKISASNDLFERVRDHRWDLFLGRNQVYDQGGNLFYLDEYSLSLVYDAQPVGRLPLTYGVEARYGTYNQLSGISVTNTNSVTLVPTTFTTTAVAASRVEGLVTVQTSTFQLSPSLSFGAGGYYRYDSYGTAQQRTITAAVAASTDSTGQRRTITAAVAALTDGLSPISSVSLSYNLAQVSGTTPFAFDTIIPTSAVSLGYSYYPSKGLFQSGNVAVTYDYNALQTTLSGGVTLAFSRMLQGAVWTSYLPSSAQFTEIDYSLNEVCDCLAVGLLYKTYPQSPSSNTFYLTVSINTLPGATKTVQF